MTHELTIIGPASPWLSERVHEFCEALAGTAWGDVPPSRLVIAEDFPAAMQQYLPVARYEAWAERQRTRGGQGIGIGVGMGFVASDGVPTAIAAALPEATNRAELLSLCCHELCELSIDATSGDDHDTMNAAMSGVVWSEHVVERRRTEVFTARDWPRSVLDTSFLTSSWNDYQSEFPHLIAWAVQNDAVPDQLYGHWQMITRDLVCAYGRAQGGDDAEEREIEAFLDVNPDGLSLAWLDLMAVCDRAFESPQLQVEDLDAIGEQGWQRVYYALRGPWNSAYVAAQR